MKRTTFCLAYFLFSDFLLAQSSPVANLAHHATVHSAASSSRVHVADIYGRLPLSFEANQGQTGPQVKFLSRGNGYSLFLTPTEAVLALKTAARGNANLGLPPNQALNDQKKKCGAAVLTCANATTESSSPATVLRMKLVGANPAAKVEAQDELPGKSNYFIGNDPKKWRTNVSNYSKVEYRDVYPGVNLVYYGNQRELEHDFVVAPGADPKAITLAFEGVTKISLNSGGDVMMKTKKGEVQLKQPRIYQKIHGAERAVGGYYVLKGRDHVAFEIAEYDRRQPLIIDPVLTYSTYLGGSGPDLAQGIAVDSSGNAYVTGYTYSTDFPTANALYTTGHASPSSSDAFVAKLNAAGSALSYSTYLGGSGSDIAQGIALDSSGNAYVTGYTSSTDFPTANALYATNGGGGFNEAFVVKLNATGSALDYSTYLGGSRGGVGYGIAVDSSGNTYITGLTYSTDFPTANALYPAGHASVLSSDAFVAKLNAAGSALDYSTYLGGSGQDGARGITVDSSSNAYVTGYTSSTDFPTANALYATNGGGGSADAFVVKLNAAGSALDYSTYLGGSNGDSAEGIAVDSSGNAYVTGSTSSTNFPTANALYPTFGGSNDGFVVKLNAAGSALNYSTYLGGGNSDIAHAIAVDSSGNAYVTGDTSSADFPVANALYATFGGSTDAFVAKLNAAGSALSYSTYLGGNGTNVGQGIAVDSSGNAYVTGFTSSTDFPSTAGSYDTSCGMDGSCNGGFADAFVVKISTGTSTLTADCRVNGSTAPVTVLVTSYVVYNANPNPASGSTCDWNPGTPLPGAFDTAAGSSCAPSFPIYTAIAGGTFSESVTVTNGSNFVTLSCPALTVQDFSISVVPLSATALPGGVVAYTVTASSINGFTGQINFVQSTTLSSGVSAAWSPTSQFCTVPAGGSCSATYAVTVGAGAGAADTGLVFHGTYAPVLTTRTASATLLVASHKPLAAWQKLAGPWSSDCDHTFGAIAIHPSRPNVIYVGSTDETKGCGVYKSINGGLTWAAINNGLPLVGLVGPKHYPPISKIAISPQLPTVIYLGTFEDTGLTGLSGRLFLSLDGGNSWLNASGLGPPQIKSPILDIAISPKNPATVGVGVVGDGIFLTNNGGVSWKNIRQGTALNGATDYFASISIAPSDPSTLYASGFTQYIGPSLPCVFSDDGCAEVNGVIPMRPFASHDGGTSWSDISDPDSSIPSFCFPSRWPTLTSDIEVSPNDRNKIYAATIGYITPYSCSVSNRGAFRSDDGGFNWQAINDVGISNLNLFPIFQLILAPASETKLYAVTGFSGVFRSTNGGNSWSGFTAQGMPVPTFTRRVAIGGNNIYALTSNGIFVNVR